MSEQSSLSRKIWKGLGQDGVHSFRTETELHSTKSQCCWIGHFLASELEHKVHSLYHKSSDIARAAGKICLPGSTQTSAAPKTSARTLERRTWRQPVHEQINVMYKPEDATTFPQAVKLSEVYARSRCYSGLSKNGPNTLYHDATQNSACGLGRTDTDSHCDDDRTSWRNNAHLYLFARSEGTFVFNAFINKQSTSKVLHSFV